MMNRRRSKKTLDTNKIRVQHGAKKRMGDSGGMTNGDLKRLRESKGMTTTELGAALGVSMRTIQNWETGVYPIPKPILKLITLMWGGAIES